MTNKSAPGKVTEVELNNNAVGSKISLLDVESRSYTGSKISLLDSSPKG